MSMKAYLRGCEALNPGWKNYKEANDYKKPDKLHANGTKETRGAGRRWYSLSRQPYPYPADSCDADMKKPVTSESNTCGRNRSEDVLSGAYGLSL